MRLGWIESRPIVQVVFHLRFVTAVVLAEGLAAGAFGDSWYNTLLTGVAWLLTTVAIYIYNGIGDLVEDRANGSARPLASGRLPEPTARALVALCAVGAVVVTFATERSNLGLVLAMLVLGWVYSRPTRPWKASIPGTFVVCVGGGLLTYAAGWQLGSGAVPLEAVVFAVAMSVWMGIAGASKDLTDVVGDQIAGRRTLPVLVGVRRARYLIAAAVGLLVLIKTAASGIVAPSLIPTAVVLAVGGVVLIVLLVHAGGTERGPYRTFMFTQYAVHIVAVGTIVNAVS